MNNKRKMKKKEKEKIKINCIKKKKILKIFRFKNELALKIRHT
jgi:hypothetical protein